MVPRFSEVRASSVLRREGRVHTCVDISINTSRAENHPLATATGLGTWTLVIWSTFRRMEVARESVRLVCQFGDH